MDALTLIAIAALIGGALALIFYPLWQQTRPEAIFRVNRAGQTLEEYQARYQAMLAAIKDLMFDYEMGKVSAQDFEILLNKSKLEAAKIRRQIDRLSQQADLEIEATVDAEIEALVAQLRRGSLNGNETLLREVDAEIELLKDVELAEPDSPDAGPADAAFTCPNCGKSFQAGDTFCAHCGQSLPELEAPPAKNVCPECGFSYQLDDLFCARCGTALQEFERQRHEDASTTELRA